MQNVGITRFRSDLGGQLISAQCFSRALLSHMHRKQGYFVHPRCWPRRKVNTDNPIVFVMLQRISNSCFRVLHDGKLNTQLGLKHMNCHCGGHTFSCQWTVAIELNCRSESPIPPVNPACYGNARSNCHFESSAKINFLWIESIP